jgi:hypothetical protein
MSLSMYSTRTARKYRRWWPAWADRVRNNSLHFPNLTYFALITPSPPLGASRRYLSSDLTCRGRHRELNRDRSASGRPPKCPAHAMEAGKCSRERRAKAGKRTTKARPNSEHELSPALLEQLRFARASSLAICLHSARACPSGAICRDQIVLSRMAAEERGALWAARSAGSTGACETVPCTACSLSLVLRLVDTRYLVMADTGSMPVMLASRCGRLRTSQSPWICA